jgi:ribosomal protein L7/L12
LPSSILIPSLRDGKMIDAIKEFRVAYGSGLKEPKAAVERMKAAFIRTVDRVLPLRLRLKAGCL